MSGPSTVQTQNAPNPLFQAAYGQVLSNAEANAAQPLSLYPSGPAATPTNPAGIGGTPSNLVAPFRPLQQQAFGQVAGQQPLNAVQPYLNQANNYLGQANAPIWNSVPQFSGAGIAQYQNPFTGQVVASTEAQLQNVNEQQANQLRGNAASQGALGGDRAGVAEGVLAGQQAAQEAPTIAGLYSQGYGQALQEFNTEQQAQLGATEAQRWLGSQGAFASGQLGQEAMGAQLSNINTELGAGAQQQQQAQANLNVPYYQFQQQQAYPFQTTSWLANIAEGTGSLAGGTGSTTYPSPAIGSQIAGLGLAGAGIAGATGGFGNNGWLSSAFGGGGNADWLNSVATARGGRIPRRAMGGIAPFPTGVPGGTGIAAMSGGSPVPGGSSPTDAPMSGLNGSIVPWASSGRPSPFVQQMINPGSTSSSSPGAGSSISSGLGGLGSIASVASLFLNRGGSVPRRAGGGGILGSSMATHLMPAVGRGIAMPRFDAGGRSTSDNDAIIAFMQRLSADRNAAPSRYPPPGTIGDAQDSYAQSPSLGFTPGYGDFGAWRIPSPDPNISAEPIPAAPTLLMHLSDGGRLLPRFDDGGIVLQPEDVGQSSEFNQFPAAYPGSGTLPTGIAGGVAGLRGGPSGQADYPAGVVPSTADYHSPGSDEEPRTGDSWVNSPEKNGVLQPVSIGEPVSAPSRGIAATPASDRAGDLLGPNGGAVLALQRAGWDQPATSAQLAGAQPISSDSMRSPGGGFGNEDTSVSVSRGGNNWAMPLIAAGLGMMGGRSPNALTNIGEGGMAGVRAYMEQPKMRQEQAAADLAEMQVQNARRFQSMFDGSGGGAPGITTAGSSAMPSGGGGIAGGALSGPVYSQSGQPLFDLGQMVRQAQSLMATGYGPAEAMGKAQMSLVEHMFDKGVVPVQGGGVMALPGDAEAAARKAGLIAQSQAPYKIAESLASRAGTPISVEGNKVVTTGMDAMSPQWQKLINNTMGGAGGGGTETAPSGSDPYLRFASLDRSAENPGGNPAQKNLMGSSAMGNDQFMPETWLHTFKQSLPSVASNLSDAQILQLRGVSEYSTAMTAAYARENAPIIANAGFPINNSSLRLAHWFGPEGAVKLMNAPASAPAESLFSPQVVQQNRLGGKTAGDIVQSVVGKFGTEPFESAPNRPATPAPEISQVGGDLPDLPPTNDIFGTPKLIHLPGGGVTASNTDLVKGTQAAMSKHIGDLPAETEKLRNSQSNLISLMDEIKTNAEGPGYLQSGTGAEFRTGFARAVNSTATTLGLTPPLPQEAIAANEAVKKGAVNASFSLARSMVGARVAVAEVQYAFKANPNLENTPFGNILMSNMLIQENQRQIDRNDYVFRQAGRNANTMLAERTFDQARPPVNYLRTAKADAIGYYFPALASGIQAAPTVANIEALNKRFGPGTAEAILKRQGAQ